MIPKIQRDFLLLFQCIIDFGAEVLRDFTEEKIKMKYKTDDFTTFLEKTKHYFYHQWDKKKVACCECPAHGCSIPKTGKMDKKIYDKLYLYNTSMKCPKGHEKKGGSSVIQTCICRYTAKHILINALDLSDLNALLIGLHSINTPMICHSEGILINEIMSVRGKVCHAVTTTTFSEPELINLWAKFTNALYNLYPGDPKNVKWLKKTIETTKKTILSEEEVQELMGKINMLPMDVRDISAELNNIVKERTTEVKNCVINESAGIKAHFDNTLQPFTDQQERHSELLIEYENRCHQAFLHTQENIITKVSEEGEKTRQHNKEQITKLEEDHIEKITERMIGRLEQFLGSHPVFAGACLSDIYTEPVVESASQRTIQIKSKITQESMTKTNEEKIIKNLPSEIDATPVDSEQDKVNEQMMHVKAKMVNSIELELIVPAGIFANAETLRAAILTLVKTVIVAGEIDLSHEDPIYAVLTFYSPLTEDERSSVTDLLTNPFQDGAQSREEIVKTIDDSSRDKTASNCGDENDGERSSVTDLLTNPFQDRAMSEEEIVKTIDDSSRDKTASNCGDENDHHDFQKHDDLTETCASCIKKDKFIAEKIMQSEHSTTKEQEDSIFLKKNKAKKNIECLLVLTNKAQEVSVTLLGQYISRGEKLSYLLRLHRHAIFHMYSLKTCCQCFQSSPQQIYRDLVLQREDFETMFKEIKPERIHLHADICICSLEAKQDITERRLPFPVVVLLLRKSSTYSKYKKQLESILLIISHIKELGHMPDMIDLYNLWKSLSKDILYLTELISKPYVEKITNEIQTLKPSFTQEFIVLNSMKEMKTYLTDHFERFHEEIQTLKEGMNPSVLKLTFDKTCEIDKEVKNLRDHFDYTLREMKKELKNDFQQALLAHRLEMERQSQNRYRQMLESKHLADTKTHSKSIERIAQSLEKKPLRPVPYNYRVKDNEYTEDMRSVPRITKDIPVGLQPMHSSREPLKVSGLDTGRPSSSQTRNEDSSKHRVIWQKSGDNRRWIGHMTLKRTVSEGEGQDDSETTLGLKVAGGRRTDAGQIGAFITKVKKGSIAYNAGHLRTGDEVIQFNDKCLQRATSEEVHDIILKSKQKPQIELIVHRSVSNGEVPPGVHVDQIKDNTSSD